MNRIDRIPKEFYRLFASKYMNYYIRFLVALYEENSNSYSVLGLTEEEGRTIINEQLAKTTIDWGEERLDEEGSLLTRNNMAGVCLNYFEDWGWLKKEYDEKLNAYVISFPDYSQLFVELFQKLSSEEDSGERESVLAVYSYLFTYNADREKNPEILKSAWKTSRNLVQMLASMQEGMRSYFDELSRQREFRGIQEVLVREINNSDSKKYAILTTTDSFYRYKEAVKELIDQNLVENDRRKQEFEEKAPDLAPDSIEAVRNQRNIDKCTEAMELLVQIEREFDRVERRYNKLIEQKTVFASRAAARIRYILQEGSLEEDQTIALVNLLARSDKREEIAEKLAKRMRISAPYSVITEKSLYQHKEQSGREFQPTAVAADTSAQSSDDLGDFVLKPLYTRKEIREFRKKNEKNGVFHVDAEGITSVEDLEKLFFVWQEATERAEEAASQQITVGEEQQTASGLTFSALTIEGGKEEW